MPSHTVLQGTSVARIAHDYGFLDWRIVWQHAANADLRSRRPDPQLLLPGDELFVPDLQVKEETRSADDRHHFVLHSREPVMLRITLQDHQGVAMAAKPYRLTLDRGGELQGTTDARGSLEVEVPIGAEQGTLEIDGIQVPVRISHLDPHDEISGVQARLHNVGFDCGPIDGNAGDAMVDALKDFQEAEGLEKTGTADGATIARLKDKHGC